MRPKRLWRMTYLLGLGLTLTGLVQAASAQTITLGDQDFADGTLLSGGFTQFNAASAGEPAPFDAFRGSDLTTTNPFSAAWTFNYAAPMSITNATVTIGIYDGDSAAPGNQVQSFTLNGNDLTSLLNTAFEAHGGTQAEDDVYTIVLPGSALPSLLNGTATFSLTLQGPGLQGVAGTSNQTVEGNGAGLDFSTLRISPTAVPEPSSLTYLASVGLAVGGFFVSRRRRSASEIR